MSITFAAVVFVTAMTAWTEDLLPSLVFAAALGVFLYLGVRPNGFLDRHDPPEQGTINWVWVGVIYVAAFIGMMAISLARPELYRRS